jgi:hypothetical protein
MPALVFTERGCPDIASPAAPWPPAGQGSLVGEFGAVGGCPAIATAISEPSRILSISTLELVALTYAPPNPSVDRRKPGVAVLSLKLV